LGSIVLTGTSSYAGKTWIQSGTLSVASLNKVSGGTASSSLGAPLTAANGTIDLGSLTSTGLLRVTGSAQTTDRVINLAGTTGGGVLDHSGAGLLTFSGSVTATDGGSTISVDDGGGALTVDGTVAATQSGAWAVTSSRSITSLAASRESDTLSKNSSANATGD
jgi:autotransporter-associated beta strand protein